MAFRIQKQRSSSNRPEHEHEGGFQIPSSQIRSKPQRDTDVSDTLGNIDDVLADQPASQADRMAELQNEADAAHAAGANDISPSEVSDLAKDSQAAAASHRAKNSQDRAALRNDMSDSAKDAKGALKSGSRNTGIDMNRPLSDADKRKYSSQEERAAGDQSGLGRLGPLANRIGSHVSGNKKAYGIGGGALGLMGLLIVAFIALLPLKLQAMMKNVVSDHFDGAVNHAVERRAEKMFFRYVIDASDASGRTIVATGSPLLDLYKTWRVGKFEDQLANKYGVKISRVGSKIRVSGPQGTGDFASAGEMEKYFGDLNHRQFRGFLREATKMTTRRHQVLQRRHIRKWMRSAYGFRIGKIFSKESDPEKAKTDLDLKRTKAVGGEYKTRLGKSLACMLGSTSECPEKTPSDPNNSSASGDGKTAGASTEETIAEDIAKTTGKDFAKDISKDLLKVLLKKVVPIIGWVDMAAHIDDFIWNERADTIIKFIRASALANSFGIWQVADHQSTSGLVTSGAEVNAAITALNGMEKSCEYQRINNGGPKQGCDKVGSDKKVSFGLGKTIKQAYTLNPGVYAAHPAYQLYLATIGKVFNWLGDIVGWIIGHIPGVSSVENYIATKFIDLISFIVNPGCTGHEVGAEAYNCVSGGADVTSNDFADQMGAPKVPDSQAYAIDSQIASENDKDEAAKGLWHRIASLDYQHSLINLIIARIPTDPVGSALGGANTMLASTNWFNFSNLFLSPFQGKLAYAASTDDPFGVEQHRYSAAELSTDIDEAALTKAWENAKADGRPNLADISPDDCPDPDKRPNLCRIDIMAIQAQRTVFTTDDDGGLPAEGGTAAAAPAPGGSTAPGAWTWPIDKAQYQGISQCWNVLSSRGRHAGTDFPIPSNTPVHAANNGTVVEAGFDSAAGNYMIVKVSDNLYYTMEHLARSVVKSGPVTAGQVIAYSDNTGSSTGAHLHFGVAVAQTLGSYANNSQTREPLDYLPKDRDESPCR